MRESLEKRSELVNLGDERFDKMWDEDMQNYIREEREFKRPFKILSTCGYVVSSLIEYLF